MIRSAALIHLITLPVISVAPSSLHVISVVNIDVFLFLLLAAVIACVREGGPSALDTTLSPSFISCCKSNDDDDDIDATDARGANWPLILYIYIYFFWAG